MRRTVYGAEDLPSIYREKKGDKKKPKYGEFEHDRDKNKGAMED